MSIWLDPGTSSYQSVMARLPVKHEERGTVFNEPTEIGRYALDGEREVVFEPLPLKYLALPTSEDVYLDLNIGYELAIKYSGKNEGIGKLLMWILKNKEKTFLVHERLQPDFICNRGLLKYVMCTPYLTGLDDWVICATKHRGIIYMVAFDSAKEQLRQDNATEREKLMSFWGCKFEQYLTSDQPGKKPNTWKPVNKNEEFYSVLRGKIGAHSLVYAAEMDVIDANYLERHPGSTTKSYVELKTTSRVLTSHQLMILQRHKQIKWWAQSYLSGVPNITIGYRDNRGVVRTLKTYKIEDLPRTASIYWSSQVCMSFCDSFLSFVKQCVEEDNPRVVYKFEWEPGEDVTCVRLTNPGIYRVLPDWYINSL